MTWYSPYNTYSNQFQYYHPYSYSSYPSTLDGMMTDGSFQNGYYAVDGVKDSSGANSGLTSFFKILKIALNFFNMASGNGGGDFGSTMTIGGFASSTTM